MFKRQLEASLVKWKDSPIRKPLILRGARQVGKTSLIRQFGQKWFEHLVEVNLELTANRQAYDNTKDVEDLLFRISKNTNTAIVGGKTLIFFDEIQESATLIKMLRFLAEEKPELHVVAAGSLLEARLGEITTFPVGRVDFRYLYPLNFEEFLAAMGEQGLAELVGTLGFKQEVGLHERLNDYFRLYGQVGGMPEVVAYFAKNRDYVGVAEISQRLITAYKDDLRKYVTDKALFKYYEGVIEVGPRIAGSLFNYENFGDLAFRSREMGETINMLEKVMLLYQVKAVNRTGLPLMPKYRRPKKLIWLDIGLVSQQSLAGEFQAGGLQQGRLMEQIVGQQILARRDNHPVELYYWSRDRNKGNAEVDFVYQHKNRTVAIEVKSGKYRQMKSMFSLISSNPEVVPVRVSWDKLKVESYTFSNISYRILAVPFYALGNLADLVDEFMG